MNFIDLFCGIGGFRLALEANGGNCVFSSEIDKAAAATYFENFGELPNGDITKIKSEDIPNFDILCGGFPCQAFSSAGKRGGFNDIRGTLFFEIARILKDKRPKAFILENVQGLLTHDKGETIKTILKVLREDLGYFVPRPQILNAKNFGVPQNRPRIFIVGFSSFVNFRYPTQPNPTQPNPTIKNILEKNVDSKYFFSQKMVNALFLHREKNEKKGNSFGFRTISENGISNALMVGGMGLERNIIIDKQSIPTPKNKEFFRKLTPRECARLQGFPETYKIIASDQNNYKLFGNSVAVPVIKYLAENVIKSINGELTEPIDLFPFN